MGINTTDTICIITEVIKAKLSGEKKPKSKENANRQDSNNTYALIRPISKLAPFFIYPLMRSLFI